MADFTALKNTIETYIKQNGNEEITGNILQEVLLAMVETLGDSAINDLITAISNEVTARQNADGTLQTNITNEATARGNADTALGGRIDGEIINRENADTALGGRIDGEITNRQNADTALQNAINAINTKLAEGYVYAGIATPSTNPSIPTGKVFYIATAAGTYTNFLDGSSQALVLTRGINILKFYGTDWSQEQILAIDSVPAAGSHNLVESGGVYGLVKNNINANGLTDNSYVNRYVKYIYCNVNDIDYNVQHNLLVGHYFSSLGKYVNHLYLKKEGGGTYVIFEDVCDTLSEAISTFIANPIRKSDVCTVIFNVAGISSSDCGNFDFTFLKRIGRNDDNNIFTDYITNIRKFSPNFGLDLADEIYNISNYTIKKIIIVSLCHYNSTSQKYEIYISSLLDNNGSDVYADIINKTGSNGFATRQLAIDYWNENIADNVLFNGLYYAVFHKINNLNELPNEANAMSIDVNFDASLLCYSPSIAYFLEIKKRTFNDISLDLLIDEIYINPNFTNLSTLDKISVSVGVQVGSSFINQIYAYRTGGLSTRVIYEETFQTLSAALSAFRGIKSRITGYVKINDVFASQLIGEFKKDAAASEINLKMLSLENCPQIRTHLYENLIGKSIVWEGDSMMADNAWNNSGWRERIELAFEMKGTNYSRGGSTLTSNVQDLGSNYWISTRIDSDIASSPNCNYFIFDGGGNDADRIGQIVQWKAGSNNTIHERIDRASFPAKFGIWNDVDFSGNYDIDTFCGALEYVIWKILTQYKGTKVGFISLQKMGESNTLTFFNRYEYYREAIAICKKWGVPFLDLWEDTILNPNLPSQYDPTKTAQENEAAGNMFLDGQHLSPTAYDFTYMMIGKWLNSL